MCEGAPIGIAEEIEPGGLLPKVSMHEGLDEEDLDEVPPCTKNHGSFDKLYGSDQPPGLDILQAHLNKGHALLFESLEQAEAFLGAPARPAP